MKKCVSLLLLICMCIGLLTGCGVGSSSVNLNSISSMSMEEVAGSRLLASTSQSLESEIYNYVSDRIVVDGSKLIKVTAKDEKNITALLENINIQLSGKGGNVLTDEYANYLLLEFAKTPYEWLMSSKDIVGFDPAARLYFVDVTYTTTQTYKNVVPNSAIPLGHSDADKLRKKRYSDYISMLTYKYRGHAEKYNDSLWKFTNAWGNVQDIYDEQQGVSLYERTVSRTGESGGIGRLTYSGLVRDNNFKDRGAKMTVRYILKYALNLGEETDLSVEALYVKNYAVNDVENVIKGYTLKDAAALEVLKPFIDKVLLGYNKCVEESNHVGLNKLFTDYSTIDKYYDEINNYTYNSIGSYRFDILERKNNGKEVAVIVYRVNQIRARGANMSLPTYEERLIFNMQLGKDDTITITDVYLLDSKLIGEPLSVIRNVTGISEQIQYSDTAFSSSNKTKVEELLKKFSDVVTNSDYKSEKFLSCIDIGVSQETLNRMADTIKAIAPNKKTMYIVNWDTKTNVYCSVTVREVFECNNGNFDTEAVIDMGNRNGEWKIVNYTRTLNIKTNSVVQDKTTAFYESERTVDGETTTIEEVKEREDIKVNEPTQSETTERNPLNPMEIPEEVEEPSSSGNESEPVVSQPTTSTDTQSSGNSEPTVSEPTTSSEPEPSNSEGSGDFD